MTAEQVRARITAAHRMVADHLLVLDRPGPWQEWLHGVAALPTFGRDNTLLIAAQRPTSTRVAGYEGWKTLGRHVMRGEKGIAVLADTTGGRRVSYLWDVAQTSGAPLADVPGRTAAEIVQSIPGQGRLAVTATDVRSAAATYLRDTSGLDPEQADAAGYVVAVAHGLVAGQPPAPPQGTAVHIRAHAERVLHGAREVLSTTCRIEVTAAEAQGRRELLDRAQRVPGGRRRRPVSRGLRPGRGVPTSTRCPRSRCGPFTRLPCASTGTPSRPRGRIPISRNAYQGWTSRRSSRAALRPGGRRPPGSCAARDSAMP
jgi:hypothetical protein